MRTAICPGSSLNKPSAFVLHDYEAMFAKAANTDQLALILRIFSLSTFAVRGKLLTQSGLRAQRSQYCHVDCTSYTWALRWCLWCNANVGEAKKCRRSIQIFALGSLSDDVAVREPETSFGGYKRRASTNSRAAFYQGACQGLLEGFGQCEKPCSSRKFAEKTIFIYDLVTMGTLASLEWFPRGQRWSESTIASSCVARQHDLATHLYGTLSTGEFTLYIRTFITRRTK